MSIERLRQLHAKAPAGEWDSTCNGYCVYLAGREVEDAGALVVDLDAAGSDVDGHYLAALHNALPRFLGLLDAAEAIVGECDSCRCPERIALRAAIDALDGSL